MRCLVIGATGFIGGAIMRRLQASGHVVVAYCRRGADGVPSGVEVERGDLGDPNQIARAAQGCDAIVHAAGISSYGASREELGWVHVAGTENVINAARYVGCKRLVYISCADVTLTDRPRTHWNENSTSLDPLGALPRSKLQAEELVRVATSAQLTTVALRPAPVWGPGDCTRLPRWCREGQAGGIRLVGKGKHLMATTHVDNVAEAAECALQASVAGGSVYYVIDQELSLARDFFSALSGALELAPPKMGWAPSIELALARVRGALGWEGLGLEEVAQRGWSTSFDGRRAQTELGYEPVISQEEGMAQLATWARERGGVEAILASDRWANR